MPKKCISCQNQEKKIEKEKHSDVFHKLGLEMEIINVRNPRKIPLLSSNSINYNNFDLYQRNFGTNSTN